MQVLVNAVLILVFLIFVLLMPPSPKTSLRRRIDSLVARQPAWHARTSAICMCRAAQLTEYIVLKSALACSVGLAGAREGGTPNVRQPAVALPVSPCPQRRCRVAVFFVFCLVDMPMRVFFALAT